MYVNIARVRRIHTSVDTQFNGLAICVSGRIRRNTFSGPGKKLLPTRRDEVTLRSNPFLNGRTERTSSDEPVGVSVYTLAKYRLT